MFYVKRVVIGILTLCLSWNVFAANYLVQPVEAINLSTNIASAAQEYMKDRLQALEVNKQPDQDMKVKIKILRFGQNAHVMVNVFTAGEQLVWTDESTAANPNDLKKVIDLLANSIVYRKKVETNLEINTITEAESEAYNRRKATSIFELRLGGLSLLSNSSKLKNDFLTMYGIDWAYDMRDFLAGFEVAFADSSSNKYFDFKIYGLKPFSESRSTFYAGGGLSYATLHTAKKDDEKEIHDSSGLALNAKIGYIFGRTDTVHFRGDIGVGVPFFNHGGANIILPQFSVGVGF